MTIFGGAMFTNPKTVLSLDLRSLAAMRVALGILLLVDLAIRSSDLIAHYTDAGILPRSMIVRYFPDRVSIYLASDGPLWVAALFVIAAIFALALLLGYRTRFATVASWFLLISLINRNPRILHGGDTVLRLLLFWGMFLPLGARYSLDAALSRNGTSREERVFGGPSIAFILQIAILYAMTALLKSGREWWPDGTAAYYALNLESFTTALGRWASQFPAALRYSTYFTYFVEAAAFFLLLTPVLFVTARNVAILALAILHVSILLTMRLNVFPWVNIAALLALIPSADWNWLERKIESPERRALRIYYDRDCRFCRKVVRVLQTFLALPPSAVAEAQERPEVAERLAGERSWVIVDAQGRSHTRFGGLITLLETSPLTGSIARHLPLHRLSTFGDRAYTVVADNRGRLGGLMQRLLPERDPPQVRPGWTATAATLLLIAYVIAWNLQTIPWTGFQMTGAWSRFGRLLRLDQHWGLFAPRPLRSDGWFVIPGVLRDGTRVDVYNDRIGDVSWEKPAVVADTYESRRWWRYLVKLLRRTSMRYRLYYGRYLCQSWNRMHPPERKLRSLEIYLMRKRTAPPGETSAVRKLRLWRHNCFGRRGVIRTLPPSRQSGNATPRSLRETGEPLIRPHVPNSR